jgi:REP element-mobilizing transposase RayT
VTQRGHRRQQTLLGDDDDAASRLLLSRSCRVCDTQVLAYCAIPNHVHLILVPATEDQSHANAILTRGICSTLTLEPANAVARVSGHAAPRRSIGATCA